MASANRKNLIREPDEVIRFPGVTEELIDIGEFTIGRVVSEPGWRWSTHVRPHVGGEWCQAHHVGIVLSGKIGVELPDGRSYVLEPHDVYEIAPGHDGFTIGDEPAVTLEWTGLRAFAGPYGGTRGQSLATLLFTDLVDSTATAVRLGDAPWRELLSRHFQSVRRELERFGGREVATTGDGFLALFGSPATALLCAAAIRTAASGHDLHVRVGVHVGDVQLIGEGAHGVAIHEAARIMGAAGSDEILVSEITRSLAAPAGLAFEDRGPFELKGLPGERRLFAYLHT